jgi:hypothetical protein
MRTTVVALTCCAWLVLPRPAIAQTNPGFELTRTSLSSVREYVAGEAIPTQLSPPPNVVVADTYRPLLDRMLRDSPTFRRQCLRIAAESQLTVYLSVEPLRGRSDLRAMTSLQRRPNNQLSATIVIAPRQDVVELIAHEFEHVIEQLDGVNLAELAALPHTGVREEIGGARDTFETERAARVGRKVTVEARR